MEKVAPGHHLETQARHFPRSTIRIPEQFLNSMLNNIVKSGSTFWMEINCKIFSPDNKLLRTRSFIFVAKFQAVLKFVTVKKWVSYIAQASMQQ